MIIRNGIKFGYIQANFLIVAFMRLFFLLVLVLPLVVNFFFLLRTWYSAESKFRAWQPGRNGRDQTGLLQRDHHTHWLKRDSIGDQYYWFYFSADDVAGRKVSFELQDLIGVYRGTPHLVYTDYTQPVFSYDQENWDRITDVSYDSASHTFFFSETFSQEPVWIAYAHPYPWSRLEQLTGEIQDQPFVTIKNIAKTAEGRDIRLVTITDPQTEAENQKDSNDHGPAACRRGCRRVPG
jgi:hypothetical protein